MRNFRLVLILGLSIAVSGCVSNLGSSENYDSSITNELLDIEDIRSVDSEFDQNMYFIDNNSNIHDGLSKKDIVAAKQNSFVAKLFNQNYSNNITSFYGSSIFVYNNTESASKDFSNFTQSLSYDIATLERKEDTENGFITEVTVSGGNKITTVYRQSGNTIFYTSVGHFDRFKTQETIELADRLEAKIKS